MIVKSTANLFPALADSEYERLKESIKEQGVLIPIEVDQDTGELLDGFHREKACEELGITPPTILRSFESDADRKVHALTLNLARRQLGPVAWGNAFDALLDARGVKRGRGSNQGEHSTSVVESAQEAGVHPNTARNRMDLASELEDYPTLAEWVDTKRIPAKEAREVVAALPETATQVERGEIAPDEVREHVRSQRAMNEAVEKAPKLKLSPEVAWFDEVFEIQGRLAKLDTTETAEQSLQQRQIEEHMRAAAEVQNWIRRYVDTMKRLLKERND